MRMTGRPSRYTRPYLGQNGIVGLSSRSYDSIVGAKGHGTQLNTLFAKSFDRDALVMGLELVDVYCCIH
jgi:hypothetical protein